MRVDQVSIMGSQKNDYSPIIKNKPVKESKEIKEAQTLENGFNDVKKPVEEKTLADAVEKVNKQIKAYDRRLEYNIHKATKQIMVKVINTEDDTVIREIPSEKVLDMVAHLWEVAGIIVDENR